MDRYVVIGNPVEHSKSPLIHSRFAEQTNQPLEYGTLLVELGDFERAAARFFDQGGKGANVTVPFKQDAWRFVEERSAEAEIAGAVNTLYLNAEGKPCGHNTDGIGLVTDITANQGGTLTGKSILILGAGGAARGILGPFMAQAPAEICIANRTVAKAGELARIFTEAAATDLSGPVPVNACGFEELEGRRYDWVINATSASLQGSVPPVPAEVITEHTWCYDLMYADKDTPFCQWAKEQGAGKVMDGLGMLVEQAAESFLVWRGIRPATAGVIAELRG